MMLPRMYVMILCTLGSNPTPQPCKLNTRIDFTEPLPIIIQNGRLLEPTHANGDVVIAHGDEITISCEGTGSILHPHILFPKSTATVTCLGGDIFVNSEWLAAPSKFVFFECVTPPVHFGKRTNRTCYQGNPIIEVGYTAENNFYPVYESCFDEAQLQPIYSKYTQKPYNANFQTRVDRPRFVPNNFFGTIPIDHIYSPYGQRSALQSNVGDIVSRYFTGTQILSRGHLAAKTDFPYAFGQKATFHYLNCASQWTGFNGGNWNTLEVDLRNYINRAGYNTVVYTGVYGVIQLMNSTNKRVDIFMCRDNENRPVMPVPLYYYKVVYAEDMKKGTAFLGINNPYYSEREASDLTFCEDKCRRGRYSWLSWAPNNSQEGYVFCCSIPDFRNIITHLPNFEVNGLLP